MTTRARGGHWEVRRRGTPGHLDRLPAPPADFLFALPVDLGGFRLPPGTLMPHRHHQLSPGRHRKDMVA